MTSNQAKVKTASDKELSGARVMFVARSIYHDNTTYESIGNVLQISKARVAQIYARYARQCRQARRYLSQHGCLPHHQREEVTGIDLSMITDSMIPISAELARYNLEHKLKAGSYWFNHGDSTFVNELGQTITEWISSVHYVAMLRKIVYSDGQVFWECNKHFFEQCLKHPSRQKGKNGIFVRMP